MDWVTVLTETVRAVVSSYATEGYDGAGQPSKLFYMENPHEHIFCVVAPYDPLDQKALLVIMARIVNDQIIIDQDNTSVSLYSELVQAGIAENQIVMAWKLNTPEASRPKPTEVVTGLNIVKTSHDGVGNCG